MSRKTRINLLFVVVAVAAVVVYWVESNWEPPGRAEGMIVQIPPRVSASRIAGILEDSGIIRSPGLFRLVCWARGTTRHLQAGYFSIPAGADILQVIRVLENGTEVLERVRIPEGSRVRDVEKLFLGKGFGTSEEWESIWRDTGLLRSIVPFADTYEGFLFPETYFFRKGERPLKIVSKVLSEFRARFSSEWESRAREIGFSPYEVVILASIVEKETSLPRERPIVAGIFIKRLKLGYKLEADPTVRYVLAVERDRLWYKDIRVKSPYNTYLVHGLPPTPICNPSIESIKPVLYYEESPYLYFVADGKGGHIFSRSLREHNRNKRKVSRR